MKKIYLFVLTGLLLATAAVGQVTVTNPTNTTPNLAATYGSLATAITALDAITAISGPLIITLIAGNAQTAPAGGYVIQFSATTSAVNTITISGSNNTITAFTPQTSGSLNDGLFKIIGADYITIQNFTMQENAANTTTAAGTNNMTEFGVALLRASTTDGAQNNIIQNNTISLNKVYLNSFGIYSNVRHTATSVTVADDITSVTGSNFGNKVYGNNISNVNYCIVFNGSAVAAQMDNGNDIGGISAATGNTLTNWGNNALLSSYVNITGFNVGIFINHQVNENVSYNTITSATHTAAIAMGGILKDYSNGQPSGTITSTIDNNTITLLKNASSGTVYGIFSQGISPALSTATIDINNNSIINCVISGSTSSGLTGINNTSICGILNMNNNLIRGNTSASNSGNFYGITNSASVVTSVSINNNQLGDAIAGALTLSVSHVGQVNCIYNNPSFAGSTATVNINNNRIDGINCVRTDQFTGIYNSGNTTVAINMNNNQLGTVTGNLLTFSGAQTGGLYLINNNGGTFACTLTIQGNDMRGIVHAVAGSAIEYYIFNAVALHAQNIIGNTFTNLSVNTSGDVTFIYGGGNMNAGNSCTCNNNSIVTAFNKTAAGGVVRFYYSLGTSVNGSTMSETGNNFSNVAVTGATSIIGWDNENGTSLASGPTKTITGNTFNNITGGSGSIFVMYLNKGGASSSYSSNTISNISGTGAITGIVFLSQNGQGTHSISSNTITGCVSSGTGGDVKGIAGGAFPLTLNISSNTISGLSSTGASSTVDGIESSGGNSVNINDNIISNLSGSGTGVPVANGIVIINGPTVNLFRNKIYNISQTGLISTTSPAINGILFSASSFVAIYNNFVCDLKAPGASLTDAIHGISINGFLLNATYNLYYNSVYLNASSTGTDFGTSGIYHVTNATATTAKLNLIDNIIVNTSTANGTGVTAAYRRSDATLTNYASTSDYNLFFAGTPGASRLIYFDGTNSDQTLAAYQTRVSTRDANSISLMPNFTSSTDLHLVPVSNCNLHRRGTPLAGITTDIENDTRHMLKPDMGADEYSINVTGTVTWTGAISADWFDVRNWDLCELPGPTSVVVINGSLPNYPVVTDNVTIKSLTINTGASIIVATGFELKLIGP